MENQMLSREVAQQKYKTARSNLLAMLLLTVVNIVLLFTQSNSMMLFSATVPYFAVGFALMDGTGFWMAPGIFVAVIALTSYLLCWIFSKNHHGWMIGALVLFILDFIAMVALSIMAEDFSGIMDVVIHIVVLYYLIIGVKYGAQLSKMPAEVMEEQPQMETEPDGQIPVASSACKRPADMEVKARILLEEEVLGHRVCYRRVKRVNELVVDGYVYDEIQMLMESAHTLSAVIDGHKIEVGFDGMANSFLCVDGQPVAKKLRLY